MSSQAIKQRIKIVVKFPSQPYLLFMKPPAIGATEVKSVKTQFIIPYKLRDFSWEKFSEIITKIITAGVAAPIPWMNLEIIIQFNVSDTTHPKDPNKNTLYPKTKILLLPYFSHLVILFWLYLVYLFW